jgi:acyl carrier protein
LPDTISQSAYPDGFDRRCPICENVVRVEPSGPIGDAPCPRCGSLLLYVAESLGISPEKLSLETSFTNDLGADSLDTVELVMELEEEFDINIPDDVAERMKTIGGVFRYIREQQDGRDE